jgi:hypothetical protein
LRFAIYDAAGGGNAGGSLTNAATPVTNGLFTVSLDFGAGVFTGADRWLEIGVRTNGAAIFTTLDSRQPLTPTPYAIYAGNAGVAASAGAVSAANIVGKLAATQLSSAVVTNGASGLNFNGAFSGDGTGLTNQDLLSGNTHGAIAWTKTSPWSVATYPVGQNPMAVVAADIHGTGKLDLISANHNDNSLTIWNNNGTGGFENSSTISVGLPPNSIATADVNGDGKLDIICAVNSPNAPSVDRVSDPLIVLTNDGSGGFQVSSILPTGNSLYWYSGPDVKVAVADVNGDGKPDSIAANANDNSLTVFTNDGSGGFTVASTNYLDNAPWTIATADVNGDGKVDLIAGEEGVYGGAVTVLTNAGGGLFVVSTQIPVGNSAGWELTFVTVADVNGDGRPDVVAADLYSNTLTVLLNNGSGGFTKLTPLVVGGLWDYLVPDSVAVADVNGDGNMDLLCTRQSGGLVVFSSDGRGGFNPAETLTTGSQPGSVLIADLNADGKVWAVCANGGDNTLSVFQFGNPTYLASFTGNGAGLTGINATNITTGMLSGAQLPANVALLNANSQLFSGSNNFAGVVIATNANNQFSGTFIGDGSGLTNVAGMGTMSRDGSSLTNLNAASLTGTLPPTLLPSGLLTNGATAVSLAGLFYGQSFGGFYGDGSALYFLNASQLASVIVPDARLSANVPQLNAAAQTFAGSNIFNGVVIATNVNNQFTGTFSGSGAGLTGINASVIISGTLSVAQLPAVMLTNNASGLNLSGTFTGDGSGLSNVTINVSGDIIGQRLNIGDGNTPSGSYATIAGGQNNAASGGDDTISGGIRNTTGGNSSVVGGGANNTASATASAVVGGSWNQASGKGAFVGGGGYDGTTTAGNVASGAASVIAGGIMNLAAGDYAIVGGGNDNQIQTNTYASTIGGGDFNQIQPGANKSTIGGGTMNLIQSNANVSTIGGGSGNQIQSNDPQSTIGGGMNNQIQKNAGQSTIGGGGANLIQNNASQSTIDGGFGNQIQNNATFSTIGGGYQNSIQTDASYASLGGGTHNIVSGTGGFVGGGGYDGSSVLGNTASGPGSVVVGGTQNIASGSRSTVGGGHNNSATNWYATVPGGAWNIAGGVGSFAAGQAAQALNDGSFVWNCDPGNPLSSSTANQFIARASGGYSFYTGTSGGATLAAGSGSWTSMSDRNAKENFAPVDVAAVLQKVAALPLSTWNYKQQTNSIRHLGPMAQDFKAAFKVGETDTGITTVDADGVALAAIQGLNQKLEEKDAKISALEKRLAELEQAVQTLAEKK